MVLSFIIPQSGYQVRTLCLCHVQEQTHDYIGTTGGLSGFISYVRNSTSVVSIGPTSIASIGTVVWYVSKWLWPVPNKAVETTMPMAPTTDSMTSSAHHLS